LVRNELGVMEELRECAFYRPRGGSGRQRRDGVLVREQRQRCSEERRCRHTCDETAKPARVAKHHSVAARSGAKNCRTVMCGLIVGPECRDVRECGSRVSLVQRKGTAPRGVPWSRMLARGDGMAMFHPMNGSTSVTPNESVPCARWLPK